MNVIDCRHVRCKRKRNTDIALACLEERAQLISCQTVNLAQTGVTP